MRARNERAAERNDKGTNDALHRRSIRDEQARFKPSPLVAVEARVARRHRQHHAVGLTEGARRTSIDGARFTLTPASSNAASRWIA